MITGDEFFESPRDWSILKYKILSCYFSQYFPKVNQAYQSGAVVADLFAGRGRFDDGTAGSPIILAEQARKYTQRLGFKNIVVLAEKNPLDRDILVQNVKDFIEEKTVLVVPGDANDAGSKLIEAIKPSVPLFLFLDPFGIKGLSLELLGKAFQRAKQDSVELLINFCHRGLPRLAGICRNLESSNARTRQAAISVREMVTEVLGGEWWIEIMGNEGLEMEYRASLVLHKYTDAFREFFRWIVHLPITETPLSGATKYFLIFASRSQVAFELMNDCVRKGRRELALEEMKNLYKDTLFENENIEGLLPKQLLVDTGWLTSVALSEIVSLSQEGALYLSNNQPVWIRRPKLRGRLMTKYFSNFTSSEYNTAIQKLIEDKVLVTENGRSRISDQVAFRINI